MTLSSQETAPALTDDQRAVALALEILGDYKQQPEQRPELKPGHVRVSPSLLKPSPENDTLYGASHDIDVFAEHLRGKGVLEPLVITLDYFIVSGHRRCAAAIRAGLEDVPCRALPQSRSDFSDDEYVELLREYNRQRAKTIDEIIREAVVDADPEVAYTCLVEKRMKKARNGVGAFEIAGQMTRCEISDNKRQFLEAAEKIIYELEEFWPLSIRGIHYPLLNNPPLRHAKKPDSIYRNLRPDYHDLCDILARARIAGEIPWDCIDDETRPVKLWNTYHNCASFVADHLEDFLDNYWRDLMQSQPDYFEILIEKNTLLNVIKPAAMKYTMTLTSGRGQCCKPKLHQMAERFHKSGKRKFVLFTISDFDPTGDAISNANAKSLRDDFGVVAIEPIRVALRLDQVEKFKLPHSLDLKPLDTNRPKFMTAHGVDYAVELEALHPKKLQAELENQILSHIDVDLFNKEVAEEKKEAAKIQTIKARVLKAMKESA